MTDVLDNAIKELSELKKAQKEVRFGDVLKDCRKKKSLSVEEMASLVELSTKHLYRIEANDIKDIKLSTVLKISTYYGVNLDTLISHFEYEVPSENLEKLERLEKAKKELEDARDDF